MARQKAAALLMALPLLAGLLATAPPPALAGSLSPNDLELYRAAFREAAAEHWTEAQTLAAGPDERLPAKVIRWLDLSRPMNGNGFAAISAFIRVNPKWPNQTGLLRQAEATMPEELPAAEVRAWFAQHPAVSAVGVDRYAEALLLGGELPKASDLVRKFWVDTNFVSIDDELGFRQRFAVQLRVQDHRSRLDRLLWEHQAAAARRMLALVDEGHQALALARLALADDEPGIEAALQRVPNSLATDGGLQFERLHWRRRKDQDAAAIDILRAPPAQLGRPVAWWTERQIVIRRLIERQDPATAYQLAANHGMTGGPPLTEAEFLAGWLALHFLKQPAAAFEHFQRLYATAATPMSRARGAYWSGRAAEARGKAELARQWYAKAAQYPTMFYGQLGAEAVGGPHPITLPEQPVPSQAEVVAFNGRELVQVVRMLHEIDPADGADRVGLFLRRQIRDAETTEDHVLLARLALEVHRPDLAIFSTKEAFQAEGLTLPELGYPSIALHHTAGVEPALLLSLIRQESTFNPTTVSSAGARGLMQLMPATARAVAAKLKVPFAEPQLTGDPDTNILLGSAYLAALLDSYNGSYILAIAAYNAGGTRVREWLTKFGDPRTGAIDPLDWIESIPIGETRNYVQRLLEALQVYRLRLGHGTTDRTLGQDLRR